MIYFKWPRSHNGECLHMLVLATKECLTGLLMAALPGWVPRPQQRQVEEVRARTLLGGGFYTFVARDGQARWMGVLDRSPGRGFVG